MRSAFIKALTEVAADDARVVFLTADLGYKIFDGFRALYPERFLNMGVSEANMMSVAAGLALSGKRPFAYSIVPFATVRCLEQIRNDVCNMNVPVVIVGAGGGYAYGANGATHHGIDDVAVMRAMPGMTVVCPADPREAAGAVRALAALGRPAYLRLARNGEPILAGTESPFEIGRPAVLREGHGPAIVACGPVAGQALEAARRLRTDGVDALVLSARTVKPIEGLLEFLAARKAEFVFVVEEHGPCGGLFEALAGAFAGQSRRPVVVGITAPDEFIHSVGSQEYMYRVTGLDADGISRKVLGTLKEHS
jgi:transketolase